MPLPHATELRPPRQRSHWAGWVLALLLLAAAGGGWYWWNARQAHTAPVQPPSVPAGQVAAGVQQAEAAPEPETAPAPAAEPQEGVVENPIEEPEGEQPPLPALADSDTDVNQALNTLLGAQRTGAFLQLDGLVRRVVATVDNLARDQAPARMWPVHPMQGRFTVQDAEGGQQIAAANTQRYTAFVGFAESVSVTGAARLYAQLYPLFQVAYEELGFPGKYFNDRLVAVIDHLLAAPEPQAPVTVHLVQVAGQVPSLRPWVRYEYTDPQLQALTAGQKIMVRVGLDNERRLKRVLSSLRAQVAKARPQADR